MHGMPIAPQDNILAHDIGTTAGALAFRSSYVTAEGSRTEAPARQICPASVERGLDERAREKQPAV
jgi:hypothetical protein